ncbi:DUF6894 family protein [Sphingomonas sp. LY54]|uniref:DUF6894 family protein n=1 Tax=Sphingomonas sp. LY54 TaxID=3095343 RepID=UPI003A7F3B7B
MFPRPQSRHREDEEGQELADASAAHQRALETARDMGCESVHEFGDVNLEHYVRVTDEAEQEVCRVTFREAFTITG